MKIKKVTIMIPTYNQSQYIEQCLKSAMMQDYSNIEIIISDDSPNDETEKIIRKKYPHDTRIKYFHNEIRLGRVGNYRHTLYEKATGDSVLNLDGDDYLTDSTYISEAAKTLDEHNDVVCTIARISYYNEEEAKLYETKTAAYTLLDPIDDGDKYLNLVAQRKVGFNHMSVLYRRDEALKVDFYSVDSTWTDSLSAFKLICGRKMAFFDKSVGVWRVHNENESTKFYETLHFEDLFFHDKHVAAFCKKATGVQPKWLNESLYHNMEHYSFFLLKRKKWKKFIQYMFFLLTHETYLSLLFISKFPVFVFSKALNKLTSGVNK
jgi:glycosyltransferase involved in cell wall biosynthesis